MDLHQAISNMYMQAMMPQQQLPPVNPAAFGGLPQAPQGQVPQGQPAMPQDQGMAQYLANKVAEIRSRMTGEPSQMGALSQMMMMQQQPSPMPQQPMRAM